MNRMIDETLADFANTFGRKSAAYGCAPGRVEVLGNHTDYNEGFILSAAIDRHIVIAGRRVDGDTAKIYSRTFEVGETFKVTDPAKTTEHFWINYVEGVVDQLQAQGIELGAFEAIVHGNVPLGSGLSSSAALEVATARFLQQLFPYEMDAVELALTCQAAENNFVGVNCGILDQFSSVMGKADHLIFLDCRDLKQYSHLPLGSEIGLVLANTRAEHELADGTYNRLREQCFAAARRFDAWLEKPITHLRDVGVEDFEAHAQKLEPELRDKARHVVTENDRVLRGVEALKAGDLSAMGNCMIDSHASSRDHFGNSCAELDTMVRCAIGLPGFYGCRLSGGGFGGCTVNLVQAQKAEAFAAQLAENYREQTGIDPEIHVCRAVDGAVGRRC